MPLFEETDGSVKFRESEPVEADGRKQLHVGDICLEVSFYLAV